MSDSYPPVILNEFQTHLYQRLDEFRRQNRLCDVNIDLNGKLFPCHRIILTAASPFFETILNEKNQEPEQNLENTVITLDKEIDAVALEEILNAIYTSRLNLLPSNVYFILKASHTMLLNVIKDACVSWIMKNTDIHYLIDACLLAKDIAEEKLYIKCVNTIASEWVRWSQTDSFREIPFEVLNLILSKCSSNEEMMFMMIIKWSKYHNASSVEVQTLLDSAKLKGKIVSTPIMSELIMNADGDLFANEKPKNIEKKTDSNALFDFNLYLNAVDVKTGVKGWGVMKINENFSESIVSNFYITKNPSACRKVVEVGMKLYCFEYNGSLLKNVFYCYDECNHRQELKLPNEIFPCFDLAAIGNTIYLLKKGVDGANIWSYDCILDIWKKSFEQEQTAQRKKSTKRCNNYMYCSQCRSGIYCQIEYETYTEKKPALFNYKNNTSFAFTSAKLDTSVLYVIASDNILSFDSRSPKAVTLTSVSFRYKNAAVCAFDDKIALSGSNDEGILRNSFNVFDLAAKRWLTGIKPMNFDRANHNLFHYNGFLYAVENGRPLVSNEKYDLKSNEWINIPSLPKRILVDNSNDVVVVSAADVFGAHVNSVQ